MLNADLPPKIIWVRDEFLYDGQRGHNKYTKGVLFGVASVPGKCLSFHVLLENGAQFARLPITALCDTPGLNFVPLASVQWWDCFSAEVSVQVYSYLVSMSARIVQTARVATYYCTVDWHGSAQAESGGPIGHKSAHLLWGDDGCLYALPNNRLRWIDPAFTNHGEPLPHYQTCRDLPSCEILRGSTTDAYFYEDMDDGEELDSGSDQETRRPT